METQRLDLISVAYKLNSVVRYTKEQDTPIEVSQIAKKVETSQHIDFLPYFEVQPPTHVASFPEEFVLKTASPIWKHAFGGRLGDLTMNTTEPLPPVYSSHEDRPSTDLTLSISVRAPLIVQRMWAISLEVKPAIRVKTFYATEPMPCLPKQTLLARNQSIRLHDGIIKLEHMGFTQLDWRYSPRTKTEEPPGYEDAVS
jgi:hypothetical protein